MIPPGNSRVPKGTLGPLAEPYCVGVDYPRKHWAECKSQIDETGELDLSNKRREWAPIASYSNKIGGVAEGQQGESVIDAQQASLRPAERHWHGLRLRDREEVV